MRSAGSDLLSLALIDARNHSLDLLARFEASPVLQALAQEAPGLPNPFWSVASAGWFAESWIARNTQRAMGEACPPRPTRLASVHPRADAWWSGEGAANDPADPAAWEPATVRAYLLETLESTLELLAKAGSDDAALYFYRLALFNEDRCSEQLVELAQMAGLALPLDGPRQMGQRPAVLLPATRWMQGVGAAEEGGFAFDNERQAHAVQVPECEIDAQPVGWAQFVEFVDDGGYDREELWHPRGWLWLQSASLTGAAGGRAPRYVEQIGVASGAVMQRRFGQTRRVPGGQPAVHVNWWEADAWCRWAGRRLPTEVEWELAACTAARQGFSWGEVWEWTGTTFAPYPGFVAGPWADYSVPSFGRTKVLRGGSFATRGRMKHPRQRRFAVPEVDAAFCGFRSCAL